MLPSMPLLMTPMKELGDDSSDSSDDSPPHHLVENGHGECHINGSLPMLTLITSSLECAGDTITPSQDDKCGEKTHSSEKRTISEPTSAQKKKKKTQHKKTLAALTPDSGASLDASAQSFAEAYFVKVRNQLDDEKWTQFVQELVNFEEQIEKRPTELYCRMEKLLAPHTDLVNEFLGFLLPHQALEVDRFMAYLVLVKMNEFFRKLNILLMKKQVRQVYSALESLTFKSNVTLTDVKESILPLLKSSPLLTNLFLELLPGEKPPDSLMTDFEQVDFKDDSEFETVMVPDCPDPYGNENCVCQCHTSQTRHCIICGIKYLNGRVYLQYGKALRPAKVIFKDQKHLDMRKWEEEKCRTRRRFMPKTMLSPGSFDHRLNADSEDDCGVKKSPRTPRIRVARPKVCKKGMNENKEEEVLEGIFPLAESKNMSVADNITEELVDSEMKHDGVEEHDFDEIVLENECNTEEDEEEYLNKGLHSENDSSLEAEDIAKELEFGNDCSFEDEEVEDIENSEIEPCDIARENLTSKKENERVQTLTQRLNNFQSYSLCRSEDIILQTAAVEKNQIAGSSFKSGNTLDKKELESLKELKVEPISVSPAQEHIGEENATEHESGQNDSDSKFKTDTSFNVEIKSEEIDIIDEQCVSTVDMFSSEAPAEGGVSASSDVDGSFKEWTREEDKIILQTFQYENGLEQTFETASLQLPNRSKEEIQERFEVLMKLLKEMISDESNSNP